MTDASETMPEPAGWAPVKGESRNRMQELQKYLRAADSLEDVLRPRRRIEVVSAKAAG
jgi:hypothetical protein